ncbi:MAG: DNA polymerase [Desulfobulbaceae bacterium]|nr:MAG: DNA polymerase [Desulfobulbaceae bacterium]
MKKVFALVDCNNFYVSCERLFRPALNGQPVVVLSNNDGCVISRSNEAKAMGIPMGEPYFKLKSFALRRNIHIFSSNYALYGDLSARVMDVLHRMEAELEVYSIDEAFLSLPGGDSWDRLDYGAELRERIRREVGIPVSIGIGPTKTLAKIAARVAKKETQTGSRHQGVFELAGEEQTDEVLRQTDVQDIWGIGSRFTARLNRQGIYSGLEFKKADPEWVRKHLTVVGARVVLELNGISCLPLDKAPASKKSIVTSRSFGQPVTAISDLREAVITFASRAAVKLREQQLEAGALHLFLTTSRFGEPSNLYSNGQTISLADPTSSTPALIATALDCLQGIYKSGYRYQKAGVLLTGLVPQGPRQPSLFSPATAENKPLMSALDQINSKWGADTIRYGVTGAGKSWEMRQSYKSPAYTTNWLELPVVKASLDR